VTSNTDSLRPELRCAIEAAQDKKAAGVTLLDMADMGAFTDSFLLCTGYSARQVEAISDAITEQVERLGFRLAHREGKDAAEWVLLDFGGFIVHIFTERAREYYDLERLWRSARRTDFPDAAPPGEAAPGRAEAEA